MSAASIHFVGSITTPLHVRPSTLSFSIEDKFAFTPSVAYFISHINVRFSLFNVFIWVKS